MDLKQHITKLVEKAAEAADGGEAMRFSQAACNAANAMSVVTNLNKDN